MAPAPGWLTTTAAIWWKRSTRSSNTTAVSHGIGIKVLPPRHDLAHALLTVGLLIDAIYSFIMRLGARGIDTDTYDWGSPEDTVPDASHTAILPLGAA